MCLARQCRVEREEGEHWDRDSPVCTGDYTSRKTVERVSVMYKPLWSKVFSQMEITVSLMSIKSYSLLIWGPGREDGSSCPSWSILHKQVGWGLVI